jgi:hypothetical protein
MKTDKNVKEWSEEYALHRCGIKTLAAWSAQELALANQRTAVLFSLLSEAGLRSDEARAFMQMTQMPELPPATRKPGLCAGQEMNR